MLEWILVGACVLVLFKIASRPIAVFLLLIWILVFSILTPTAHIFPLAHLGLNNALKKKLKQCLMTVY